MTGPDTLWGERLALIARVGDLWRGDWTGHRFDGRDGQRWLDTAAHGNAGDLLALADELASYEAGD